MSEWEVYFWCYEDDFYDQAYWGIVTSQQAVKYLNDGYAVRLV